jgi:UDP-N-acetylmuramoyl-L-alanyl-D-glutamate--2,6-diaminopimelate ligase
VVLETTSHGLDQFRFWGIDFEIGILTNVTYEHLDYHRTMDEYLKAKAILLKKAKIVVLNRDDWSYEQLITKYRNLEAKTVTYGVEDGADFNPKKFRFKTTLPGDYNQHNCLAAIAATSRLGLNEEKIKDAVATFKGVLGRMDEIKEGQDFKVFVDFAHTPNALEQVLSTLKKQTSSSSRLITVFGSAGFRDRGKRPIMGEVACRLADLVVLTTDDPRTEDANQIIDEIAVGCQKAGGKEGLNYYRVPNRQEAINFAIQKLAKKGDIVALCGKGHERSLTIGQNEYPWSEHQAARKSLEKITKVGQK